jgi:hypothetical protein
MFSEKEEESKSSFGSSDEDDAIITPSMWAIPGVMAGSQGIPFTCSTHLYWVVTIFLYKY